MIKEIQIEGVKIKYNRKGLIIEDSYKIQKSERMYAILSWFIIKTGYQSKRTIFSWIKEWKAHNRLYKLGIFKENTKDCDLEENEKLYRLIIYEILGR